MRLNGKTAIVTGAGRGIGKAIARKFLQEGANVVICDIRQERLENTKHELAAYGTVESAVVNVTSRDDIERMVQQTTERFGGIDILANNAGIARFQPFLEIDDKTWNDTLAVNLTGVFLCSQIVARQMVKQRSGAIVNMSSTNGLRGEAELAHYNASKGGVLLLTKTMAIELAPYNIRVNAVCPGSIRTDLAGEGGLSDEGIANYLASIPMNRHGHVDEVANAFAFLASDEASYINGAELVIDGGQICHQ